MARALQMEMDRLDTVKGGGERGKGMGRGVKGRRELGEDKKYDQRRRRKQGTEMTYEEEKRVFKAKKHEKETVKRGL